jgi:uncharacterized small protein (DUF1192 family)
LDEYHELPFGTFHTAINSADGPSALAAALSVEQPLQNLEAPPPANPRRLDMFDVTTIRRVIALLQDEVARIEGAT